MGTSNTNPHLKADIFAEIPHLSRRQSSLAEAAPRAYIQYACVAFPSARRSLSANLVYFLSGISIRGSLM